MKIIVERVFLILVFSAGFMRPHFVLLNNRIPLTDFIFVGVSVLFFLAVALRKINFRWSLFYLPLAIYFLSLSLSTIFSVDPKHSLIKLLGITYLMGLAVLTFNLAQDVQMIKWSVWVWLIATTITCLISLLTLILFYVDRENIILQYTLSHYGTLPPGNYPRILSSFFNVNMYCNYLNIGAMFALLANKMGWLKDKLFYCFAALFLLAALFTISPGLGGIGLCVGLWLYLEFVEKKKLVLAKFSLAAGILIAIIFFLMMLPSPVNFHEPSSRVLAWKSATATFFQYPIFGKGLGQAVADVHYLNASGFNEFLTDAHQLWLSIAGQAGIIGLLAILFLTLYFFQKAFPFKFTDKKSYLRGGFGLAFISAFIYQGFGASFEDARQIWILIGLFGAVTEKSFPHQV